MQTTSIERQRNIQQRRKLLERSHNVNKTSQKRQFFSTAATATVCVLFFFSLLSFSNSQIAQLSSVTRHSHSFCYAGARLGHMNTSSNGFFLPAISSSNVTIFSRLFAGSLFFCCWAMRGFSSGMSFVMDRSNSLTLRGTKYSTRGSAPTDRRAGVFR